MNLRRATTITPAPSPVGAGLMPTQSGLAWALTVLRSSRMGLLVLALVIGAGAGVAAIGFRWLITTFTLALSGHADYAGLGPVANPHVPGLGRWFVLFTPVIAGLVYGPLVHFFAREARGHGVPEVMYAVSRRGGRIAPQVAAVKALASALCIGGGGSVGREGPIVQIGAALGSTFGRVLKVTEPRVKILVACGSAGGIAATFNAPLAGVFFAMELILGDFSAQAFGMVVLASVTASVIGRSVLGNDPFLTLPTFTVDNLTQYALFAVLGLLAGVVGVMFTRILYVIEDVCDRIWHGPEWLRPAVGGFALGGLLLLLPEMYGVGYPVLGKSIAGSYGVAFLVLLLFGKIFATSLTIGIGGSGGVFAPSLFIGAMLGSAYGEVLRVIAPDIAGSPGVYGLIGMGAVFAGAAKAPITAVVILFELTGEYTIILPLMVAIVLASAISHVLARDSIYTFKLRRRGVDISVTPEEERLATITVEQIMEPVGASLRESASLHAAAGVLSHAPHGQLPVLDAHGRYRGIATAQTVAATLADGDHNRATVASVVELPDAVKITDHLTDALSALDSTTGAIPVLDADHANVVGWLSHQRVLALLHGASSDARELTPVPV
ncbi:chloride channel protein [Pengzhenrongella phosphoraccumulans]|uniref:chloride channel protein n=1 Tax=Pengzhenrongella phosphoraccumulans TaxID=3114394 RepID=UPI00388EB72A